MALVYSAKPELNDNLIQVGKQTPKVARSRVSMLWKWQGDFVDINKMSFGQLRTVKKVCSQHKGNWFGFSWLSWIEECDRILKQEELKTANIKAIKFLGILATHQSDTQKLYKLKM